MKNKVELPSIMDVVQEEESKMKVEGIAVSISNLLPVLKKYHEDLVTGQNNIINERLGIERVAEQNRNNVIRESSRHQAILGKYDALVKKLDKIYNDAPGKLTITVEATAADKLAFQTMYDGVLGKMKELHEKQLEDIQDKYSKWVTDANEHKKKVTSEIRDMLKDSEGFYVSGFFFWIFMVFFWIGIITTFGLLISGVTKAMS